MADEEPSLADKFIADSYRAAKHWRQRGREAKIIDTTMELYRNDMRRAHRFVLDDEFVQFATLMQATSPEKILSRIQYATLPYEVTWIEFNLFTKMQTIHAMRNLNDRSLEGVPQHLGMILHRLNDTDTVCTLVSEYGTETLSGGEHFVQPHLSAYFFSTTERDFVKGGGGLYHGCEPFVMTYMDDDSTPIGTVQRVNPKLIEATTNSDTNVSKGSLWGYGGTGGFMETVKDVESLRTPAFLLRHGDTGYSRMYRLMERAMPKISIPLNTIVQCEMAEFTGTLRFIVTVLAMLNEVPVRANYVQPMHQQRIGLTGKRRLMDYHRVSLSLPKTTPIPFIERHLRGQDDRHHRAHEVRSHWRTYLHDVRCRPDAHQWEYDHDDGYRLCGKCMAFSRLIKEHIRGNAELGWVRKDYVLKKA